MPSRSQPFGGGVPEASAPVVIPPFNLDPVWSLKPWPAELEYRGRVYEFPAAPATAWLVILMDTELDLDRILVELCPTGLELILDEHLDQEILYESILELLTTVAARRWWIALRLVGVVRQNWHVLGPEMVMAGVDPQVLSLAGWLDCMTVLLLRAMDPKDVPLFVSRLELPPASEVKSEQERVEEMEMSVEQFLSMR